MDQELLKETIKDMERQVKDQQKIIDNLKRWVEPKKIHSYHGADSPQSDTEPWWGA